MQLKRLKVRTLMIDVFDIKSIESAIKELNSYSKRTKEIGKEVVKELADVGAKTAGDKFAGFDVEVSTKTNNKGAKVVASGDQVAFLEFGTGTMFGYGHPRPEAGGRDMSIGSWSLSKQGKGHYNDPNGWWYKDGENSIHTFGNAPVQGMYDAEQSILQADLRTIVEGINDKK